ncbi:MAG: DUF3783 domain-containing protein [Syntrophales bacterium]|jgi:hypothetical protein|nr:DUF3783 domain-containing protein [Syntrophales bacterium]
MEALGVLIYGYNSEDASRISTFLDEAVGCHVFLMSASEKNGETVIDILQNRTNDSFVDEKTKILLLLGFTEEQVRTILGSFPSGEGELKRPIFCMLTEENRNWPLDRLLEHLEAERRYWAAKKQD